VRNALRPILSRLRPAPAAAQPPSPSRQSYETLYEAHAQSTGDDGIGGGEYHTMGEIELDILRGEGLQPTSTLLDFGCGNGRLAVHAVPYLDGGRYIGIDISPTFLRHAEQRIAALPDGHRSNVVFVHQTNEDFHESDASVDVACAFSVFTHMEHEDMLRYLVQFRRIIKPGGRLVISCLPLSLDAAREIFKAEAAMDHIARWQRVRNVVTSVQLVEAIAELAGWRVVRWLPGDQPQAMSAAGETRSLGQSVVVLTH
jgi:cyclopropane fatty-acyl-phospholipid synthase-like methyltransferase